MTIEQAEYRAGRDAGRKIAGIAAQMGRRTGPRLRRQKAPCIVLLKAALVETTRAHRSVWFYKWAHTGIDILRPRQQVRDVLFHPTFRGRGKDEP